MLSGKRIYPTGSVKYLGLKIGQHLTWQHHINDLSVKLNRANALFKIRKFVNDKKILRSIYFAIYYTSECQRNTNITPVEHPRTSEPYKTKNNCSNFEENLNPFNTFNSRWNYFSLLILIIYLFISFCLRLVYT